MEYQKFINHLADLNESLSKNFGEIIFSELCNPIQKPLIGDWSNPKNMPIPSNGDGIGDKSGIYIFTTEDHMVLYIGKATKNNIHQRIWDHLKTPKTLDNGWKIFPKNKFRTEEKNSHHQLIFDGKIKIGVIQISPAKITSLAEVYLQTIYLPPLCKQIG